MNNKYFICYYLHTVLLKKMLIIHKFLWNQVKQLLKKIYITKPFTVYFRKLGLGLVLLWFVDDLLRGSNLQISCTHEFLAPFLKEMDFSKNYDWYLKQSFVNIQHCFKIRFIFILKLLEVTYVACAKSDDILPSHLKTFFIHQKLYICLTSIWV